jgi:gamma-glutamyltranspeptidase/glutathione hydrolase
MVAGQKEGAQAGMAALRDGGNAVDAAVTAALAAAVVALPSCGIGGYGGAAAVGLASGKVTAIDFNTEAPSNPPANPPDHGWLSAGTPGTLAGLDLALHRYGTRTFRQCLAPAIRLASEGFEVTAALEAAIRNRRTMLAADPGSAALLLPDGQPPKPGSVFRNPALAKLLESLARDNSSEAFYRGPHARHIAAAFASGGGTLTAQDLGAYEAREVSPLRIRLAAYDVFTAPLASGGATTLQALAAIRLLPYGDARRRAHARIEALRLAWQDRLSLFGDPRFVDVPIAQLLGDDYAEITAARVRRAVEAAKPLSLPENNYTSSGTIHISAFDAQGNCCAITLTHGDGFGACVTVPDLGLILGHGVSRFERTPGHPNAVGPRKSPLHNMCPAVVMRDSRPVLAIGATGGKRIPSAVCDVLVSHLLDGLPLDQAVAAPRIVTTGGLKLALNARWNEADRAHFVQLGFRVSHEPSASVQAVSAEAAASGQ